MKITNITKQHILNAVEKIEKEGIALEPSTKYDVIIDGKAYPPKEIMRYANREANGSLEWPEGGGNETNKYLEMHDFEIRKKGQWGKGDILYENLVLLLRRIGLEEATIFFDAAGQLLNTLGIKTADQRLTFGSRNKNKLTITIGQRYCLVLNLNESGKWQFISDVSEPSSPGIDVSEYDGPQKANYYRCKDAKDILSRMDGIIKASARELARTVKSGFRESSSDFIEKAVLDTEFRKQLFDDAFGLPVTNYWKLGCHWGGSKVSYYELLKQHEIIICPVDKQFKPGDLILITEGFKVRALAQVLETPVPVTENAEFQEVFEPYTIEYSDNVLYAKAEWYELDEDQVFICKIQQGICQINETQIRDTALNLWNNRKGNNPISLESLNTMVDLHINTILYGPPGTGKTYQLNEYKTSYFTDEGISKSSEEVLKEKIAIYPLWKVLGAILSVADQPLSVTELLENPLVVSKMTNQHKTPRASAWRSLQAYADDSSTLMDQKYRGNLQLFHKSEESKWAIADTKKVEIGDIIDQELLKIAVNPSIVAVSGSDARFRYNFITFHQKYSYEDFIEGIKPLLQDEDAEEPAGELKFELKRGIFYTSCLEALKLVGYSSFEECYQDSIITRKAKFDEAKGKTNKQFALFIDEINRANISAVFGELITLLEDDKRMGAANEMWVELPYSNEKFCVPSNLYVIGTMNTADRSIALLDIALRRRFEFKALYPLYTEVAWWSPMLEALNQAIYNWKKNPDFFIGHAFFMNKPETERSKILNTKIIPLLLEYCQNNAEMVKKIMAEARIQIKQSGIRENYQIMAE